MTKPFKTAILLAFFCLSHVVTFCEVFSKSFSLQGYGSYNVLVYIPDNSGNGKLPGLIFIPGNGESTTNINDLYRHGPFNFIRNGWKPNFVVIAVQPRAGGPVGWTFTANALDSIFSNPIFRIREDMFAGTGLSYGAAAWYIYMRNTPPERFRNPYSLVLFSITQDAGCGNFYQNNDYLCGNDFRYSTVRTWGLCGWYDSHFGKQRRFHQRLTEAGFISRWTSYGNTQADAGHCCWNPRYDPNWKEAGMSIYDFMFYQQVTPVKFSSFSIQDKDEFFIYNWETETEINSKEFHVQISEDGVNYKTVGVVQSKAIDGNSQQKISYSFQLKKIFQ